MQPWRPELAFAIVSATDWEYVIRVLGCSMNADFQTSQYQEETMTPKTKAVPSGLHSVTPNLTMQDAGQAIDFYKRAFGAAKTDAFPHTRWEGHHARGSQDGRFDHLSQ